MISMKMKTLNKKAQNFNGAISILLGLFIIAFLIFALIFTGSQIKKNVIERQSFSNLTEMINLSGGASNPTVTLSSKNSANPDIVCLSLRQVIEYNSSGLTVQNDNFTFSGGSACTIRWNDNASLAGAGQGLNKTNFNVSYDYDRLKNQGTIDVINQTNTSFGQISAFFPVVAVIVGLTILFGIIFLLVKVFRDKEGGI